MAKGLGVEAQSVNFATLSWHRSFTTKLSTPLKRNVRRFSKLHMGLDATVYCDCFETGRLKEPPPCASVFVSDDGSLGCGSEDLDALLAFDQWRCHRACDHPAGVLLHHRLGNLTEVGLIRSELQRDGSVFPNLLSKVLYSGTHAGDYLALEDISNIEVELERLSKFVCAVQRNQELIDWFCRQMIELAEAAKRVGKPISF